VDAVPPGVAERLHLLGLARDVGLLAVLHVARLRRHLPVGVELDAVGRVEIDALHLPPQPLALGETRHHLQAVTQDHAVRPVLAVLIELGALLGVVEAVEVGEVVLEQARLLVLRRRRASLSCALHQVLDDRLRMHLLLDVERRRVDHEVRPVLPVLAAPDELRLADLDLARRLQLRDLGLGESESRPVPDDLRVQVLVALAHHAGRQRMRPRIAHRRDGLHLLHPLRRRRQLRRRDIPPRGRLGVAQRLHLLGPAGSPSRRIPSARHQRLASPSSFGKLSGAWVPAWSRSPAARASGAGMTKVDSDRLSVLGVCAPLTTHTNVIPAPVGSVRTRPGPGRDPCAAKRAVPSLCAAPHPRGRRGSRRFSR
jgi:hypothetical protein